MRPKPIASQAIPGRLRCDYTDLRTPIDVVQAITHMFEGEICLDPFTDKDNWVGAERIYTSQGETKPWADRTYANPPYGSFLPKAIAHCHTQARLGHRIAMLLPCGARFSTSYFQDHTLNYHLTSAVFFDYRLKFLDAQGRSRTIMYDSALWCYNIRAPRVKEAFREHGRVLSIEVM